MARQIVWALDELPLGGPDPQRPGCWNASLARAGTVTPLVRFDRFGALRPGAATAWELDGCRARVRLREGLSFSDGTPARADELRAAWSRALDRRTQSPALALLSGLVGAEDAMDGDTAALGLDVYDLQTLDVTFDAPPSRAFWEAMLSAPSLAPVALADDGTPLGTGPFVVAGWDGTGVEWEPNPYVAGAQTAVSLRLCRDPEVAIERVAAGHWASTSPLHWPSDGPAYDPGNVRREPAGVLVCLRPDPAGLSRGQRHALAGRLDRRAIAAACGGRIRPSAAFSPFEPDGPSRGPIPIDAPLGSLALHHASYAPNERIADEIRRQLGRALVERIVEHRFAAFVDRLSGDDPPALALDLLAGHFAHPMSLRLSLLADMLELDGDRYVEALEHDSASEDGCHASAAVLADRLPVIPLGELCTAWIHDRSFAGVQVDRFGTDVTGLRG